MALSLMWGLYATILLILDFRLRIAKIRLTALALFALTAGKLLVIDMAHVEEVSRIISFIVLGILMIGASYLYHRAAKGWNTDQGTLVDETKESTPTPPTT